MERYLISRRAVEEEKGSESSASSSDVEVVESPRKKARNGDPPTEEWISKPNTTFQAWPYFKVLSTTHNLAT